MSVYTWLDYRVQLRNDLTNNVCQCKNKHIEKAVNNMQSLILAIEQEENYLWYKGNPDYLMWFYTRGIVENGFQNIFNQYLARNWTTYYWTKSALESEIKRTHSGLPRQAIVFLDRALGDPIIKCKDKDKDKLLEKIFKANNGNATMSKQKRLDMAIGDGAYIININQELSDYPLFEYIDGRDIQFENVGDKITAVIFCKRYTYNDTIYTCFERRTTERKKILLKGYKTYAVNERALFVNDSKKGFIQVPLNSIPQTENLQERETFKDIPFMLAVPCIREIDDETKRGVSMFRGRIDLFDDLDQSLSQESNTMRAITPVEYVDSNLLEKDKEGNPIMPSAFGKQYITYKGGNSYSDDPKGVMTTFYNVDFNKLSVEAQEGVSRCLNGWISPASFGFDISRKDNALAQREKEKITLQTLKDFKEYEVDVIEQLGKALLTCYDLMTKSKFEYKDYELEVAFKDYATPTLSEKINTYKDAVKDGVMSVDRFILECYGDESEETQEKEKQAILESLNRDMPKFSIMSQE